MVIEMVGIGVPFGELSFTKSDSRHPTQERREKNLPRRLAQAAICLPCGGKRSPREGME
jgi:hypothetical protein